MKMHSLFVAVVSVFVLGEALAAGPLPRSAAEAQGVSSSGLLKFVEALDSKIDGMHSVMVVRHGQVVAEGWWTPYNPESRHTMYSLSKSFTSTAVGMAVAEGKLSIDDALVSIFADEVPENASANLKGMRIRDLLAMSTGHHDADIGRFNYSPEDGTGTKAFMALPVAHKPGTHFVYNTPASFMLSAAVQKKVGQPILEYLAPRLFEPLGIEGPIWETNKQGINMGGFGLHIRTEDIAKFGQLYLQEGKWNGKQLLPKAWVAAATSRQTSNGSSPNSDWEQGYGYQFWRCRNGAYRGDGAFGQYCVVLPEQDAVVAITSGVRDMQAVLNVIWNELMPAFEGGRLKANKMAQQALDTKLKSLILKPVLGGATAEVAARKYGFETNSQKIEAISFEANALTMRVNGTDYRLPYAPVKWEKTKLAFSNLPEQPVAVSGGWSEDKTLTAKIAFYETPFLLTLKLKPSAESLEVTQEMNVGFGGTRLAPLKGKAQ